jgi:hypothetical protein
MLYQVIIIYLLVGIVLVFKQYDYLTKIALKVLNKHSHLTLHWSQEYRKNYVNYVMPFFFIFVWLPLLLPHEED